MVLASGQQILHPACQSHDAAVVSCLAGHVIDITDMIQICGKFRGVFHIRDTVHDHIQLAPHLQSAGFDHLVDDIGRLHGCLTDDDNKYFTMADCLNTVCREIGQAMFIRLPDLYLRSQALMQRLYDIVFDLTVTSAPAYKYFHILLQAPLVIDYALHSHYTNYMFHCKLLRDRVLSSCCR